jgi:hypothetical protein
MFSTEKVERPLDLALSSTRAERRFQVLAMRVEHID